MLVKPIILLGLALLMSNVAAQDSDEPEQAQASGTSDLSAAELAKETQNKVLAQ